jgi:DNA repair protein RecO (recombination protein O)
MIISTDAIILNSRKYGETSKLLNVFTRNNGKIMAIAKGARSRKNKFASSLDPLSYSKVTIYQKSQRDLQLLTGAELIEPLRKIHESYNHLSIGLMLAESVDMALAREEENIELFDLFLAALRALNQTHENSFGIFALFQLELTKLLGFEINLEIKNINHFDKSYFLLDRGAFSEARPGSMTYAFTADLDFFHAIHDIADCTFANIHKIELNDRQKQQIYNFFIRYFSYHMEKRYTFKSFDIFKENLGL